MKSQKHDDNTTRIAVLETTASHIHETLERIEKRLDSMNEKIDKGFSEVNGRVDKINDRLWSNFLWLLGVIVGVFMSVTGFIAHALHWI